MSARNTPASIDGMPLVSVIVCAYNQQRFIRETIESALAQTYPNVEVIVSDDGSSDDTPKILHEYGERYPGRVKAVFSASNTGIPGNMNRAMARRTGELTAWLDGDDLMAQTKLAKQVAFLQAHPDAVGCYTDAEVFESDSGKTLGLASVLYNGTPKLQQGRLEDWFFPRYYVLPSTFMARSAVCPPHGFDERLKYKSEILFFAETFRTGRFLAIPEPLTRYRRHGENLTGSSHHRDVSLEYDLIMCAIWDARYPKQRAIFQRFRRTAFIVDALKAHREGNLSRYNAILLNLLRDGEWVRASALALGLAVFGKRAAAITGMSSLSRPGWIARLSRAILQ